MKTKYVLAVLALLLLALGFYAAFPKLFPPPARKLNLALDQPDALIRTASLAQLPRDLLQLPVAREVLTEDLADYYENHEDRLALAGTLRRIAFEHHLTLPDRVLESVFDENAEVALWRGPDGSLKYYLLAMTRNRLARLVQLAATVVPGDLQVHRAGTLPGGDTALYALDYGYQRTLLFAARGDRVVVLSDPGMLLQPKNGKPDPANAATVESLLEADDDSPSLLATHFGLGKRTLGRNHEVVVSAGYLSFGYQHFAPAVEALRFSFDDSGHWQTQLRLDNAARAAQRLDAGRIWQAMPHGASLCSEIPANWQGLAGLAGRLGEDKAAVARLASRFKGPAGVCWYPGSRLYTPLFLAYLDAEPDAGARQQFGRLFAAAMGDGQRPDGSSTPQEKDGTLLWQARRPSRQGTPGNAPGEVRGFTASLGLHGHLLAFSADPELVQGVLDVAAGRYPAAADSLPAAQRTLALIDPAGLSRLFEHEAFAALPRNEEPILRNAADAHLLPRLQALGRFPAWRLVLSDAPASGRGWVPVEWQAAAGQ